MLSAWEFTRAWFETALAGMAAPWAIAGALALTTLLLEDVAIAAGVALATHGSLAWILSFAAVALGIAVGDLGLYALGLAARRVPALRRRYIEGNRPWAHQQLAAQLPSAVLLARVIPGLRLATYTACGFFRLPAGSFFVWVVLAVALWTGGLYVASVAIGAALARQSGLPLPVAVALPILAMAVLIPLARMVHRRLTPATRPR